jgi:high-affinity Fe2+/Pb2+ permease
MPSPDRVAYAHERLAARTRRVRLIRRRVVAGTLAAFVLAWGVVVFDGSMGAPASTVTAQATSTAATATSSTSSSSSSSDISSSSSDDATATMTTSQS